MYPRIQQSGRRVLYRTPKTLTTIHPSPNEDACHDQGNLQDLCEKCRNCWEFCSDRRQWCVSRSHSMLNVRFTHPLCLARSTKLTLGTLPSLYSPTLQNNRVKQDIIREVKKESYPYGTDVPGMRSRSLQGFSYADQHMS